jgi:hypothetical protein
VAGRRVHPAVGGAWRAEARSTNFVSFTFSNDAVQECSVFHDSTELAEVKRNGRIIKLLSVQEILDEEHVQKM